MRVLLCEPEGFCPRAVEALAGAGHEVVAFDAERMDFDRELAGAEAVVVRLGVKWDEARLAGAPRLRAILTPTTGLDHIDLEAAERRGIRVMSLRGLPGLDEVTSTPELAFGLLLALARRIPAATAAVRKGEWNRDAFVGRELRGKCVGIIGCGRTGVAFGGYCEAFGMRVAYVDPFVTHDRWERLPTPGELAKSVDVLSLHVHLTAETRGMINREVLKRCRRAPMLINTSRGAIVDELALLEALERGWISGAALDVVRGEPEKGGRVASPLIEAAGRRDNLLITPHIAGATSDAMRHTENMIVRAFLTWQENGYE